MVDLRTTTSGGVTVTEPFITTSTGERVPFEQARTERPREFARAVGAAAGARLGGAGVSRRVERQVAGELGVRTLAERAEVLKAEEKKLEKKELDLRQQLEKAQEEFVTSKLQAKKAAQPLGKTLRQQFTEQGITQGLPVSTLSKRQLLQRELDVRKIAPKRRAEILKAEGIIEPTPTIQREQQKERDIILQRAQVVREEAARLNVRAEIPFVTAGAIERFTQKRQQLIQESKDIQRDVKSLRERAVFERERKQKREAEQFQRLREEGLTPTEIKIVRGEIKLSPDFLTQAKERVGLGAAILFEKIPEETGKTGVRFVEGLGQSLTNIGLTFAGKSVEELDQPFILEPGRKKFVKKVGEIVGAGIAFKAFTPLLLATGLGLGGEAFSKEPELIVPAFTAAGTSFVQSIKESPLEFATVVLVGGALSRPGRSFLGKIKQAVFDSKRKVDIPLFSKIGDLKIIERTGTKTRIISDITFPSKGKTGIQTLRSAFKTIEKTPTGSARTLELITLAKKKTDFSVGEFVRLRLAQAGITKTTLPNIFRDSKVVTSTFIRTPTQDVKVSGLKITAGGKTVFDTTVTTQQLFTVPTVTPKGAFTRLVGETSVIETLGDIRARATRFDLDFFPVARQRVLTTDITKGAVPTQTTFGFERFGKDITKGFFRTGELELGKGGPLSFFLKLKQPPGPPSFTSFRGGGPKTPFNFGPDAVQIQKTLQQQFFPGVTTEGAGAVTITQGALRRAGFFGPSVAGVLVGIERDAFGKPTGRLIFEEDEEQFLVTPPGAPDLGITGPVGIGITVPFQTIIPSTDTIPTLTQITTPIITPITTKITIPGQPIPFITTIPTTVRTVSKVQITPAVTALITPQIQRRLPVPSTAPTTIQVPSKALVPLVIPFSTRRTIPTTTTQVRTPSFRPPEFKQQVRVAPPSKKPPVLLFFPKPPAQKKFFRKKKKKKRVSRRILVERFPVPTLPLRFIQELTTRGLLPIAGDFSPQTLQEFRRELRTAPFLASGEALERSIRRRLRGQKK